MDKASDAALDDPLSQVAWQTLRSEIIAGSLPPGARLRIGMLRETYGIGASPLREALSRLVSDGFVVAQERRGFVVAPMSLAEFRDLTNIRKLLETQALRSSLEHGDDVWEVDVLGTFHKLSKAHKRHAIEAPAAAEEWETLNEAFHNALVAACTSPYTLRFRRTVYGYAQRYRRVCLSIASISRNSLDEHRQLCEAALARDADRAGELIELHLEATYDKVAGSGRVS